MELKGIGARALLSLILGLNVGAVALADDLITRLREKPANCEQILERTVRQFVKNRSKRSSNPQVTAAAVKERASRLVAAQIQRIESSVLRLYEQRDELQNQSPRNERAIRAVQRKIDASLTPEALSIYRSKIREWKKLQSEIETTIDFDVDMMISEEEQFQAAHPDRARLIRPRWVLKWATVGAVSLPVIVGGVVPGASQVLKWASESVRDHDIQWAQSILPEPEKIPDFKEAATGIITQGIIPASDAAWNAYGSSAVNFIQPSR